MNILFSSTQQSKCFYLVLLLLALRVPASTVAITLHSKTKTSDEGFGKAFKYLPQAGFLFVGCKIITIFLFLISLTLLLRAGDIEANPGAVLTYNDSIKIALRRESEIKIYHLNVQSILSKKEQLRTLVHDLGPNCIFFVSQKHGFVSLMIKRFQP